MIESQKTLLKMTTILEMLVRVRVSREYDRAEREADGRLPQASAQTATEFVAARSREQLAQELEQEAEILDGDTGLLFVEVVNALTLTPVGRQIYQSLIARLDQPHESTRHDRPGQRGDR